MSSAAARCAGSAKSGSAVARSAAPRAARGKPMKMLIYPLPKVRRTERLSHSYLVFAELATIAALQPRSSGTSSGIGGYFRRENHARPIDIGPIHAGRVGDPVGLLWCGR